MKKSIYVAIIFPCFLFFLGFLGKVSAANVEINIDREYVVNENSTIKITERRTVVNNTSDKVITRENNSEVFTITALYSDDESKVELEEMVSSASVKGEFGGNLLFDVSYEENSAFIEVDYPSDIASRSSYTFVFEYTNIQLASKSGALFDVYIQAFNKDFSFDNGNVSYYYTTTLKVPTSLGEENFVIPSPIERYNEGVFDVYVFNQDQLIDTYVWVQRGKTQYYKFKISQLIPSTESKNTGNRNEYRMVIPRSHKGVKIEQEVFFTNINPSPELIETDSDGNLIGVFLIPSHESRTVVIEGYAVVKTLDADIQNAGTLKDIKTFLDEQYIGSSEFWEVNDPQIQAKASELKGDKVDVYSILNETYDYIVDSIDYSQVKRFGINKRQGALATLNGGAAVCMEYSDLYITLLRAQGIPSRAAFGYGYDSKDPANQQELHQWVQAYVPSQDKWLNIDPTWGENGPSLIGGDMNHFLTHVASVNPNEPSTLSGKTFGSKVSFDPVDFRIEVLPTLPNEEMITQDSLLSNFGKAEKSDFSRIWDQIEYKLSSGIDSIRNDGVDLQNSAQLILLSITLIGLIIVVFLGVMISKFLKREKSHSFNDIYSKKL